jgi:ABC-type Mn2+/Zn2+ transport system ATPase subunit
MTASDLISRLRIHAMIELVNVTQHYGVRPVLKQISLRIERGETVVIVGPNGMGKTTLLGVMGGAAIGSDRERRGVVCPTLV